MAEKLNGVILAAGRGERLRLASGGLPKPLIEVNGEPLLMRQIRTLRIAGAGQIHVIINSETNALRDQQCLTFPDFARSLVRDTPNSMESLLAFSERITTSAFILMMVDAVIPNAQLVSFVKNATKITSAAELRLDGALGVVKWRGDANPLFAHLAHDGTISALGGRGSPIVTAGVYMLPKSVFSYASEARRRGLDAMRRFLALLLEKSMRFAAIEVQDAIDLDEAPDLEAVRTLLNARPSQGGN